MAAARVLRTQVRAARAHAARTVERRNPEELHDLRVSVRRLRAALRLYAAHFPDRAWLLEDARVGLGGSARCLGRARDLDVHLGRFRAWIDTSGRAGTPAANKAIFALERKCSLARGPLVAHLRGPLFEQRLSKAEAAAVSLAARGSRAGGRGHSAAGAHQLLRRPTKRVLAAIERVRGAPRDAGRFHELRIEVKRLRYTIEFLSPHLFVPHRQLLHRLRGAQAVLGALQDAVTEGNTSTDVVGRGEAYTAARLLIGKYRAARDREARGLLSRCVALVDPLENDVRRLRGRL